MLSALQIIEKMKKHVDITTGNTSVTTKIILRDPQFRGGSTCLDLENVSNQIKHSPCFRSQRVQSSIRGKFKMQQSLRYH